MLSKLVWTDDCRFSTVDTRSAVHSIDRWVQLHMYIYSTANLIIVLNSIKYPYFKPSLYSMSVPLVSLCSILSVLCFIKSTALSPNYQNCRLRLSLYFHLSCSFFTWIVLLCFFIFFQGIVHKAHIHIVKKWNIPVYLSTSV